MVAHAKTPERMLARVVGVGNFGLVVPGLGRPRSRHVFAALLVLSSVALAACSPVTVSGEDRSDVDVLDKVRSLDLTPRQGRSAPGSRRRRAMRKPRSTPAPSPAVPVPRTPPLRR